jgi:Transcriptional repressor of class III stress genes
MSMVSDGIEAFICSLLEDCNEVELRRNQLAQYFGCAPSQINYVLTTRFSIERGYLVHSKRGGGGYVLVERIPHTSNTLQQCLTERIGRSISLLAARSLIANLMQNGAISEREAAIMRAVIDQLPMASGEKQDAMRAYLMQNMLKAVLHHQCQGDDQPSSSSNEIE